jgi:hypothetical protein
VKVFLVLNVRFDSEYTRYLEVEKIFSTRALAEEYASFELDELVVQEHHLNEETLECTKRTKRRVEDGRLEIRESSSGKSFVFK